MSKTLQNLERRPLWGESTGSKTIASGQVISCHFVMYLLGQEWSRLFEWGYRGLKQIARLRTDQWLSQCHSQTVLSLSLRNQTLPWHRMAQRALCWWDHGCWGDSSFQRSSAEVTVQSSSRHQKQLFFLSFLILAEIRLLIYYFYSSLENFILVYHVFWSCLPPTVPPVPFRHSTQGPPSFMSCFHCLLSQCCLYVQEYRTKRQAWATYKRPLSWRTKCWCSLILPIPLRNRQRH